MNINRAKNKLFNILESDAEGGFLGKIFGIFIVTLIFLNVILGILETVESIYKKIPVFFNIFEAFSVTIFTIEYILRLWSCTSQLKYQRPFKGRIKFALSPLAVIDLISILPFYLPMIISFDLRFMRALRLFRIFRIMKIGRYFESIRLIGVVFVKKKEELFITVFMVILLLLVVSSIMYYVETEAQPKAFSNIPTAMWWGVATLTTVGYGDVYPVTPLGKFLGAIISLLGIGMFALPTGILGSGFVEELQERKARLKKACPHCGKDIE
jgi:voltage-gated potassium channel